MKIQRARSLPGLLDDKGAKGNKRKREEDDEQTEVSCLSEPWTIKRRRPSEDASSSEEEASTVGSKANVETRTNPPQTIIKKRSRDTSLEDATISSNGTKGKKGNGKEDDEQTEETIKRRRPSEDASSSEEEEASTISSKANGGMRTNPPRTIIKKRSRDLSLEDATISSNGSCQTKVQVPTEKRKNQWKRNGAAEHVNNDAHVWTLMGGRINQFESKYEVGTRLGQGGFGTVFAGVRKSDQLPVAIKRMKNNGTIQPIKVTTAAGKEYYVPLEVVLLHRVGGDHTSLGQNYSVSLIEWFCSESEVIIVMEKPERALDLYAFFLQCLKMEMRVSEEQAKDMIRQLIEATEEMSHNGVFHRDLKCNNILVQRSNSGYRIRIVDFGCGSELKEAYDSRQFHGTKAYAPPEMFKSCKYYASTTNVWQVGAVLFEMLTLCQFSTKDFMEKNSHMKKIMEENKARISRECHEFLSLCLKVKHDERLRQHELLSHSWFQSI